MRALGVQSYEPLTESQIFQDEILSGAQDASHPANEVPEQRDHGPRSYRNTWLHALWKSFILRVQEVLTRHSRREEIMG
jgi:hypothetical protein